MRSAFRSRLLALVAALLTLAGSAGAAEAGWITIRNDTNRVVVVQGTAACNGHPKRGKPVRLLPGESVRELHQVPSLTVEVFDGQSPGRSLFTGTLTVKPESQAFAVGSDGRAVHVVPASGR